MTRPATPEVFFIDLDRTLGQHPLSAAWPPMDPETFQELRQSIQDNGVETPIVIYEGQVLDGWHRYNCTQLLGDGCPATEYDGDDPVAFVIRANNTRRHISNSVRAQCVVKVREWRPRGRTVDDSKSLDSSDLSAQQMAEEIGVGESTIRQAKQIERGGFGDAVRQGEMTPGAAIRHLREQNQQERSPTSTYNPGKESQFDFGEEFEQRPADEFGDFDFPDFGRSTQSTDDIEIASDGLESEDNQKDNEQDADTPEAPADPPLGKRTVAQQAQTLREDEMRQENAELRQRLDMITAPVDEKEIRLENLQLELRTARSRLNDLVTENEILKRDNAGLRRENDRLNQRLNEEVE